MLSPKLMLTKNYRLLFAFFFKCYLLDSRGTHYIMPKSLGEEEMTHEMQNDSQEKCIHNSGNDYCHLPLLGGYIALG